MNTPSKSAGSSTAACSALIEPMELATSVVLSAPMTCFVKSASCSAQV